MGFSGGSVVKNSPANAEDAGLLLGLGRSLREGNGNPRQYSCLEIFMGRGAWQATVHEVPKIWTGLSNLSMHTCKQFRKIGNSA